MVHGLEDKYSEQIQFTYLDIDDPANQAAMQDLVYIGRPHLYLLDGEGNIIRQWLGFVSQEELETAFVEVLP